MAAVALALFLFSALPAESQPVEPDPNNPEIALSFPPNVQVSVLIDYVAQRLEQNILYDEQVARAQVTLQSPAPIAADALMPLLETVLRAKGFALIDLEQPGWKQVVPAQNMPQVAALRRDDEQDRHGAVVTRVFTLQHVAPATVEPLVRPTLTPQGSQMISDPERGLLIITDFADVVTKAEGFITLLDQPGTPRVTRFITARHMPAAALAQDIARLQSAASLGTGHASAAASLQALPQERTNQVVLIGAAGAVAEAQALAEQIDVDLGLETRVFALRYSDPARLDTLARRLIETAGSSERLYRATVDPEGGLLVVTATPTILTRVEALRRELDSPITEAASPIRFYKLQNANAADVLATIRAIEGSAGLGGLIAFSEDLPNDPTAAARSEEPRDLASGSALNDLSGLSQHRSPLPGVEGENVTVAADENTNTLIVIGDPSIQRVYETLIKRLDKRRPQVMIEATIVTIDTSNNESLGVEIKAGDDSGETQTFAFSQFGLSQIGDDGRLDIIPGVGFNGAVLQADVADVVIRAIKGNSRAKVVSAPKLLVNDNATGSISSVAEQPVTSINQGQNTDTVTFSEFVGAGTSISVTPHIAEGDYLRLEFEVALDSFTGEGSGGIPPPRQSNTVTSEVTIPDGSTIVVGGINRKDDSESVSRIPILGELPILEYAFSNRTKTASDSTLFVFLRPVILRDDQFADLKHASGRDLQRANIPGDPNLPGSGHDPDGFPASVPMLIK